ncbi:MAG TPA: hypothetical protein VNT26_12385 [Candidatus Sulfotelmatobacter sp.]|nr:hypothetical protein [Candidatus Sulfotelmatobacter sp.]
MKKLILSVMVAAFAVAVQAGEAKACADKEKGGCCAKAKAAEQTKAECPMAQQKAKATCPYAGKATAKDSATKPALTSPKATTTTAKN